MGEVTKIAWCQHTYNPWIGCTKVSEGCKNCYASVDTSARVSASRGLPLWGPKAHRQRTKTANQPKRWNKLAKAARLAAEAKGEPYERPRVFCASLCDVFEGREDLDPWRADLWKLIEQCDELDFMLLTKRPENIPRMVPASWLTNWPAHVWIGTSVENQETSDERIPRLLQVPAKIRFLSMEPLLGPVKLSAFFGLKQGMVWRGCLCEEIDPSDRPCLTCEGRAAFGAESGLHLVIVGGEGNGGRPFDLAWARSIRDECKAAGVAFFMKQLGSSARIESRAFTDEEERHAVRYTRGYYRGTGTVDGYMKLKSSKGGDPSEWPADLRVREMPTRAT